MAVIDYEKVIDSLNNKILKEVHAVKGVAFGEEFITIKDKCVSIEIQTSEPEYILEIATAVIKKSKYGVMLRKAWWNGQFDWASDTYLKDGMFVDFIVK